MNIFEDITKIIRITYFCCTFRNGLLLYRVTWAPVYIDALSYNLHYAQNNVKCLLLSRKRRNVSEIFDQYKLAMKLLLNENQTDRRPTRYFLYLTMKGRGEKKSAGKWKLRLTTKRYSIKNCIFEGKIR